MKKDVWRKSSYSFKFVLYIFNVKLNNSAIFFFDEIQNFGVFVYCFLSLAVIDVDAHLRVLVLYLLNNVFKGEVFIDEKNFFVIIWKLNVQSEVVSPVYYLYSYCQ